MNKQDHQAIDIGVNLTNRAFIKHWREVIQRALEVGVEKVLLTGVSLNQSRQCADLTQTWLEERGQKNLYCTIGVHPHDAKTYNQDTTEGLKEILLQYPTLAVAVGECGLDYNRNFSPRDTQRFAFREQVQLACQLQLPLFVHEREAHHDLLKILDDVNDDGNYPPLPPIVIHCFTGTEEEALTYIDRGYYIGFTGTICKKERGKPLREILTKLPLEKIMIETDAPFMGFKKGRKNSEPADVIDVAKKLGEVLDISFETVCEKTTENAISFFRLV